MIVRSVLTRLSIPQCPAYDYRTPVIILVMFIGYSIWYFSLPSGYDGDPYDMGVIILMLLFSYLDGQARWHKWRLAGALRILTWGWIAFGFFYLIYWSRVLYPLHASVGS